MKLAHQTAIVTGAGRNIGEETAKLFAGEGAAVAVVEMDRDRADKVTKAIHETGGKARSFICDVSREDQIADTVRGVMAEFGRIDILINNVANSDNKHLFEITKEEWDRVFAVCLTAPMLFSKYAAKQMIVGGRGGKIVNVSSTSGHYGRPRAIAYTAAKAGVINLTRSLAIQLAEHNIRVNCVVPNKIGSPVGKDAFNPNRKVVNLRNRPGEPIDLARAMLFLVSEDSDFIAGTELFVDGGCAAMMPGGRLTRTDAIMEKLKIKRVYEPRARGDGQRVLVDRIWPRGISKETLADAIWLKEIAPSTALRKWFGHDPERWQEFRRRYKEELKSNPDAISKLRALAKGKPVTLLYSARDEDHNQAVVLAEYLEAGGEP